jgi:hypothetical protein
MLIKSALIHAFGQNAKYPLRAALVRLAGLSCGAIVLGVLFAGAVQGLPIMAQPNQSISFFGGLFVVQLTLLLSLHASASIYQSGSDTFARLLLSWPLRPILCSFALVLPTLMLTGFTLLLIGWPLGVILDKLGISPSLTLVCLGVGTACVFGLLYGLPNKTIRLVVTTISLITQYQAIQLLIKQQYPAAATAILCVVITTLVGLCLYAAPRLAQHIARSRPATTITNSWLGPPFWLIKKVMRDHTVMGAVAVNVCIAVAIAIISERQHAADVSSIGLFGALLAGSCSADVRGLAVRNRPAEITALRGTYYFMVMQCVAASLCGAIIAIPIAIVIPSNQIIPFAAMVVLGLSAGLFSGTLIVPKARDIMGQFLALLIVLAIVAGLSQLPPFSHLAVAMQMFLQLIFAICFLFTAFFVEYKRNNFTWRNNRS